MQAAKVGLSTQWVPHTSSGTVGNFVWGRA